MLGLNSCHFLAYDWLCSFCAFADKPLIALISDLVGQLIMAITDFPWPHQLFVVLCWISALISPPPLHSLMIPCNCSGADLLFIHVTHWSYFCLALNHWYGAYFSFVERFPHKPVFNREPRNQTVVVGSNVTFVCGVLSDSHPLIQWVRHYKVNDSYFNETGTPYIIAIEDNERQQVIQHLSCWIYISMG